MQRLNFCNRIPAKNAAVLLAILNIHLRPSSREVEGGRWVGGDQTGWGRADGEGERAGTGWVGGERWDGKN